MSIMTGRIRAFAELQLLIHQISIEFKEFGALFTRPLNIGRRSTRRCLGPSLEWTVSVSPPRSVVTISDVRERQGE